ncbi:MAG TPA: PAS domain-containing protein [Gemmatimonadaceae bacterium]
MPNPADLEALGVTEETARRLSRENEASASVEGVVARLRESEERYRVLVDTMPQSVWTTDASGRHTFFSRGWYAFTGATPEESYGSEWTRFIHPDDRERMEQRWRRSLETGEPYEIEYRFRGADGKYHWFLGRATPLRNAEGRIIEWFGTATDISEQKRLGEEREQLLARERAARDEVTTILESITDAFFAVDRDFRFTYLNREAEQLLRRSRAELLGRCVWDEFPEAVGARFEREYRRAMAEQTTVQFEERFAPLDIWVDVHAYPSEDGLSVFFRDVTRRKRAEDALRESERNFRALAAERERLLEGERQARAEAERRREELERVTESRTRLMRGFSHDVKNPLGAADGHAQLLEDGILGALTPKQLDSVRRIRRSISTSLRLIQDLLELARAEAGQIDIECVTTDVGAAAREVAEDFQAQAAGAGLELKCHAGAKVLAVTDPTRVRQIIANLLSNAVKYAPNGTVTIEAALRESGGPGSGRWVAASVADTGPGIPADKHERIFQEFTRLDPDAQAGAGVGLAISRRIARLLGGDLTVESEVGRGSTFTLWLPPASSAGGTA